MYPSVHTEPSKRVRMTLGDTELGGDKTELHVSLDCDIDFQYGEYYTLEFSHGSVVNHQWFTVPGAYGVGYRSIAYSTANRSDFVLDLKYSHGILPAGRYRLVMEFHEVSHSSGEFAKYLSKEFAFAEFYISEPIITNPFINSLK